MGVQNLTGFVEANHWLMVDCDLRGTPVVIDSRALQRFVFDTSLNKSCNAQHGGDYVHYGQELNAFFDMLDECNIEPIMVRDGGKHPMNAAAANNPDVLAATKDKKVGPGVSKFTNHARN